MIRVLICVLFFFSTFSYSQNNNKKKKKKVIPPFKWVNPIPANKKIEGLHHKSFKSSSMGLDVGYCIYLPKSYEKSSDRFPVVYYLHGGRPGSEIKSISLVKFIHNIAS